MTHVSYCFSIFPCDLLRSRLAAVTEFLVVLPRPPCSELWPGPGWATRVQKSQCLSLQTADQSVNFDSLIMSHHVSYLFISRSITLPPYYYFNLLYIILLLRSDFLKTKFDQIAAVPPLGRSFAPGPFFLWASHPFVRMGPRHGSQSVAAPSRASRG